MATMQHLETTVGERWRAEANNILRSRVMITVFCLLLAVDLFFIVVHFYFYLNNRFQFSSFQFSNNFILIKDRGYSEWWEYVKMAAATGLSGYVYARSRQPVYLVIAIFCVWSLADNAFELHEQTGSLLAPLYAAAEQSFASAAQTLGEITYFAAFGLTFAIAFVWAWRGSGRQHRAIAVIFAALVLLLAVFGVGVDALHEVLRFQGEIAEHAFAIIEDGGELMVMSAIAAMAAYLVQRIATRPMATGGGMPA